MSVAIPSELESEVIERARQRHVKVEDIVRERWIGICVWTPPRSMNSRLGKRSETKRCSLLRDRHCESWRHLLGRVAGSRRS
jgi:hypothetical protein